MQIYSKSTKNATSLFHSAILIPFVLSDRACWGLRNFYTELWNSLIMQIYANLKSTKNATSPLFHSGFWFRLFYLIGLGRGFETFTQNCDIINYENLCKFIQIHEKWHLSSIQKSQQICTCGGDVYYASRNLLSTCFKGLTTIHPCLLYFLFSPRAKLKFVCISTCLNHIYFVFICLTLNLFIYYLVILFSSFLWGRGHHQWIPKINRFVWRCTGKTKKKNKLSSGNCNHYGPRDTLGLWLGSHALKSHKMTLGMFVLPWEITLDN